MQEVGRLDVFVPPGVAGGELVAAAVAMTWEVVTGSATMISPEFGSKLPLTAPRPNMCRVVNANVDGSMRYEPAAGSCTAEVASVMVGSSIGGWCGVPTSSRATCNGVGGVKRPVPAEDQELGEGIRSVNVTVPTPMSLDGSDMRGFRTRSMSGPRTASAAELCSSLSQRFSIRCRPACRSTTTVPT